MANAPSQADAGTPADERPAPGAPSLRSIVTLRDFCLRAHGTDCARCQQACPAGAISFSEQQAPIIDFDRCTNCCICLGTCDAFSSTRITTPDQHARARRIALRGDTVYVTCSENVFEGLQPADNVIVLPCLASLSPEFWALLLSEGTPVVIAADLSYCADCALGGTPAQDRYSLAIATAEEWTGRSVGFDDKIPEAHATGNPLAADQEQDRRSLFATLLGEVEDIASGKHRLRKSPKLQDFHERRERSRAQSRLNLGNGTEFNDFAPLGRVQKTMHPRRRMLLEAIDADPGIAPNIPLAIASVDASACQAAHSCWAACPTGACHPSPIDGQTIIDARYCVGCGLCASACPQHAIALHETTAASLLQHLEDADAL